MRNYISLGPVSVRISRKGIADWGYPIVRIGGLEVGIRCNGGGYLLASYHPKKSGTWHWSARLEHRSGEEGWSWADRTAKGRRRGQWHDYYRLPFGWKVIVSQQDYHLWPKPANAA